MRTVHFHARRHVQCLGDLVAEAKTYAVEALRTVGAVRPTLLATTPRGVLAHYPERLIGEKDKEQFATECRLLAVATEARSCAVILEAWMTHTPDGQIPDLPPSEHPARREVLTISAESRYERRFLLLPIRRSALGVFERLGENEAGPGLTASGRFVQILPLTSPSRHRIEQAQIALEAMGVRCRLGTGFSTN